MEIKLLYINIELSNIFIGNINMVMGSDKILFTVGKQEPFAYKIGTGETQPVRQTNYKTTSEPNYAQFDYRSPVVRTNDIANNLDIFA